MRVKNKLSGLSSLACAVFLLLPALRVFGQGSTNGVTPVPEEVRSRFGLNSFYEKYASAGGLPVLSSGKASDFALLEAAYLIDHMLEGREDIRQAMISNKVRFVVMAASEFTTAVPEHSTLTPAKYWDKRARGLGATRQRPAVSCGEENLLCYAGDPYAAENILIHEFAHAIHEMGLNSIDPTFQGRLKRCYDEAIARGLWKKTYAATHLNEYWAEAVQSWFDTNRENDGDHNHVNTREELKEYDPEIAKLVEEVFGDRPWRYKRPADRVEADRAHLKGYDANRAPRFEWPKELVEWNKEPRKKSSSD